jgi:signal transduction histidine kinase/ActR/RegA family two-component response regulator
VPSGGDVRRAVPLRRRLLLLAAGAVLPLALMTGVALQALLQQQQAQIEQSSLDLSRALATAVDTELRLTISTLQTLAATEPVSAAGTTDLPAFRALAERVLAGRPEWLAVILADPSGNVLFNSGRAPGPVQPAITEPDSFRETVQRRVPVVGVLARGPRGAAGIPVRIPMLRDGAVRFVLTAVMKPEAIRQVVDQQRVPVDWIVSVFDQNDQRVARSRDHAAQLGTAPSPSLARLQANGADEGAGETDTLEGERVYSAYTRLKSHGWTVAIGLPAAVAVLTQRHSALAYGGGILLSLGLGSLAAWLVARSIAEPIGRLGESALRLGQGETPAPEDQAPAEIRAASQALVAAAEARQRAAAERERLLAAERLARAAAEQARQRLELLAGASSLLSRSLDERTTLDSIASVVVPAIADWCRIDLLDANGVLQRKLTHHSDPARRDAVAALVAQGSVGAGTRGSFPDVIATGQPYLANFDTPEASGIADPTFLAFARATGMRAACVVPLIARGRTIGAMGALQAESGRRFSEDDGVLLGELAQRAALALDNGRLYAESEAALHEAKVANRAKDDFLAMLGHELRNPLSPILTTLTVMARLAPDAAVAQRRIIERQVRHLAGLVDDLLDVSRIVAGKVQVHLERLDMRDVVRHAVEMAQPALRGRTHPVEVTLPDTPAWVAGDAVRLAQVVDNLLGNAAKFSTADQRIAIALEVEAGQVRLVVSDEGAGIAAPLLARIFDRFVQAEQPLQRAAGGLGLGLAIARGLIELHHGTIRAESGGPGRGSRFIVELPEAGAEPVVASAPAAPPSPAGHPRARILVVDDNADAAEALAELLRLEGYSVLAVGSAEAALEAIGAFAPHAALLDIGLPKMDGYALAQALRADPGTRDIRLIALTGYGRAPDRQRAREAGFDEHLVKPAPIETLLARLAELVGAAAGATP